MLFALPMVSWLFIALRRSVAPAKAFLIGPESCGAANTLSVGVRGCQGKPAGAIISLKEIKCPYSMIGEMGFSPSQAGSYLLNAYGSPGAAQT